ncbi:unnamed protein product [Diamesa serratosioi]
MWTKIFICLLMADIFNGALLSRDSIEINHPNIILMLVNNLHWNDVGIHVNQKDNENATPNIDSVAYSGVILNRFYANGGISSLLTGANTRNRPHNTQNVLANIFQHNGYKTDFINASNYHKVDAFQDTLLTAITMKSSPFLLIANFGNELKIPLIDDIVGAIVLKTKQTYIQNNTLIVFLSLLDNDDHESSTIEINVRKNAFIYSPLLKFQQRVSNQLFHITDWLPTFVHIAQIKLSTGENKLIDGINQWPALNEISDIRREIYGNNFYINDHWKLAIGSSEFGEAAYGSLKNQYMESDNDLIAFNFDNYFKSIITSDTLLIMDHSSPDKILLMKTRAKVHCNLKDNNRNEIENIKCSKNIPCLFDLSEDPCEFDNKHELVYENKRNSMKINLEKYLAGASIDFISIKKNETTPTEDNTSWKIGAILAGSAFGGILMFIIVVCVKEKCNRRRSVYTNKTVFVDQSDAKLKNDTKTKKVNVSVISN